MTALSNKVKYPFGKAAAISVTAGATMAATIENSESIVTISQMAAAGTLNLTLDAELVVGAVMILRASADGTNRVLTPGTGMTGAAQTITASKSFALTYKFDGTTFVHTATQQLN